MLALDFDGFLADVRGSLSRVVSHFGLPPDGALLAAVAQSPVLGRYSKAPERPYAPGERSAGLERARHEHREEIRHGLAWIERMARADDSVAALLPAERP